jgi:uncharacterized protein YndB with AHSA1/START domain
MNMENIALKVSASGDREIAMSRVFNAPRELVFDSLTNLALLKRWFGLFAGWALAICEIDLKVGGAFRFVWRNSDGMTMVMRGVYREIVVPEKIVNTESVDGYPGEAVTTTVLTEEGGRTTLTATIRYESPEIRDAVLKSNMKRGAAASYDKLAQVLTDIQAAPQTAG